MPPPTHYRGPRYAGIRQFDVIRGGIGVATVPLELLPWPAVSASHSHPEVRALRPTHLPTFKVLRYIRNFGADRMSASSTAGTSTADPAQGCTATFSCARAIQSSLECTGEAEAHCLRHETSFRDICVLDKIYSTHRRHATGQRGDIQSEQWLTETSNGKGELELTSQGEARHVHERSTARKEVRKNRQEDQQGKISKSREKGRKIVERVVVVLAL